MEAGTSSRGGPARTVYRKSGGGGGVADSAGCDARWRYQAAEEDHFRMKEARTTLRPISTTPPMLTPLQEPTV